MAKPKTFAIYDINKEKIINTVEAKTMRLGAIEVLRTQFGVTLIDITDEVNQKPLIKKEEGGGENAA